MLLGLLINNLAIVKRIELNFDSNLVVITGETGAGKTIIMNAIGLACGSQGNTDMIRTGCESATVEASFYIGENTKAKQILESYSVYDGEDAVVISRTLSKSRGKILLNGHIVSIKQLQEVGKTLIDMHGQHEVQSLLDRSTHLFYLDKFGGETLISLKEKVSNEISEYKELRKRIEELKEKDRKLKEESDLINYEISELERANLRDGEEEELEQEYNLLSNMKELLETLENVQSTLQESDFSVIKLFSSVVSSLNKISSYASELKKFNERANAILIDLKELSRDIGDYASTLSLDPERLSFVENRLDEIGKLKFKYKKSVKELIDYLDSLRNSVRAVYETSDQIIALEREENTLSEQLKEDAITLSHLREEIAKQFEEAVEAELKDLAMENAKFFVSINQVEDSDGIEIEGKKVKLFSDGIDSCEFLISPNPPHDFKPLVSIASGGELSRVMLAIKHVIAKVDEIPVLAFDEVDSGIGGKVGEKVAQKLYEISQFRQVICITHLPQIASLPAEHFLVEKVVEGDETFLNVKKLNEYERITEIARMISGTNITETTIKQSKELLGGWEK